MGDMLQLLGQTKQNCSTNLLVEFGTEVNGVWFSEWLLLWRRHM